MGELIRIKEKFVFSILVKKCQKSVKCGKLTLSNAGPFTLIAGPCQLESEKHALNVASELKKIGVSMATIMSNNTELYPDDSYDNMKLFSKKHDFTFPYLYDSTQEVAKLYQAVCTPDIYGFNQNKILKSSYIYYSYGVIKTICIFM